MKEFKNLIGRYGKKTNVVDVLKITNDFIQGIKMDNKSYNVVNDTIQNLLNKKLLVGNKKIGYNSKIKTTSDKNGMLNDLWNIIKRKSEFTGTELYIIYLLVNDKPLENIPIINIIYKRNISPIEKYTDNVLFIKNEIEYKKSNSVSIQLDIATEQIVQYCINHRSSICAGKAQAIISKIHDIRIDRRLAKKQAYINSKSSHYLIKSKIGAEIFDKLSSTYLNKVGKIKKYKNESNKPLNIYSDILHLIEQKEKWNFKDAYMILNYLMDNYSPIYVKPQTLFEIDKILK